MQTSASVQPWYRQPWPWFLISLPAIAVVAGTVTLVIAIRSNDGLVADDYYTQGLAINKTLARGELAAHMGLRATIRLQGDVLEARLSAREGVALPAGVRLLVLHPTREGADEVLSLVRAPDTASWRAKLTPGLLAQAAGRRTLVLEDEARSWRLNGEVLLGATEVELKPQAEKPEPGID